MRLHVLKLSPNDDLEAFLDKLAVAEILRPCCADPSKLPKIKQPKSAGKKTAYAPASNTTYISKRSGTRRKGIGIGVAVIAVIAAVILAMTLLPGGSGGGLFDNPADQYAQAMSLISQGSYYDAYVVLEKLGSYEDNSSQLAAIKDQAMLQKLSAAKKRATRFAGAAMSRTMTRATARRRSLGGYCRCPAASCCLAKKVWVASPITASKPL